MPDKILAIRRNAFPVAQALREKLTVALYQAAGETTRYHLAGSPHCPIGTSARPDSSELPLYEIRRNDLCPQCTTGKGYTWFMSQARKPTAPRLHQVFAYALDVHDLIAAIRRMHRAVLAKPEYTKDRYQRMLAKIDRFEATRVPRLNNVDLALLTEHAAFLVAAERLRALHDPSRTALFFADVAAILHGPPTSTPVNALPLDQTLVLFAGRARIEVSLQSDLPKEILLATRLPTSRRGRQWAYCLPRYVLDYLLSCLFSLRDYFTVVPVPNRAVAEVAASLFCLEDPSTPTADLTQLVAAATAVCETA